MGIGGSGIGIGGYGGSDINASCYVDGTSGTPIILKQKNISSITDLGVGHYILNFTADLASETFVWAGQADKGSGVADMTGTHGLGTIARTVSSLTMRTSTSSAKDTRFSVIIMGA